MIDHAVVTEGEELAAVTDHLQLHTPIVSATAWAFTMIRGAVGFFVFGIAFALRRSSEPAYVYAAVAAVWAVGTFTGNAIAPMLRRRTTEGTDTARCSECNTAPVSATVSAFSPRTSRPLASITRVEPSLDPALASLPWTPPRDHPWKRVTPGSKLEKRLTESLGS